MAKGIKFTGDFKKVRAWSDRFDNLSKKGMDLVSHQLAEETLDLVREGFEKARDPSGRPWAPLKIRSGTPLSDTGGLRSSWSVRQRSAKGFSVASHKAYAIFHQGGTGVFGPRKKPIKPKAAKVLAFKGPSGTIFAKSVKGSPKRRMVPESGRLPALWKKRLKATAIETIEELLRG